MKEKHADLLKEKCSVGSYEKLTELDNPKLQEFIAEYIGLCSPDSVHVCDDSKEDKEYIRNKAVENKEELKLAMEGHTVHFDGEKDQARDKQQTKYLLPPGMDLGPDLNSVDKQEGLEEVKGYLKDIMKGKEMYVLFFCLGPTDSEFSIPCVQITDSSYVAHSEYILYRSGYEQFRKLGDSGDFFRYVHSAGELTDGVSKNIDKRRVYIDLEDNIVYSTNTQYAGNTVGLKKLSLRLAIQKASREGWLAEHMLLMGVNGPEGRKTYFAGAFPSACGKTSTAMIEGETIVGDDIAYLRNKEGKIYGANVESGIFGIIRDVNPENDPVIWEALTRPGEVIFSNVLMNDEGVPFWLGDGRETPGKGRNYSGEWTKDKKDKEGNQVTPSHKNARYTVNLHALKNVDPKLDDPEGVIVRGIIYGGRDSSVWPPVQQAFDWTHGVVTMGAALESETTAATLGKEGVRQFNPMSNLDFVSIPLGRYIENHLNFVKNVDDPPVIFAVNYFQKDSEGNYLTEMEDKRVWVKWMELRVNGDVGAIKTPTGYIPKYEDLKRLFKEVLGKEYTQEQYIEQFTLKVLENLAKIERIYEIYSTKVADTPNILFEELMEQENRLSREAGQNKYVSPYVFQRKQEVRK
ncbi:MAG: phosphoenolpyruvate carboxykinase (GTP) [Candidatus Omnitrophica bacterium]|nr:phosphoenolpyruvate carboxykinase (GTP) [Candidatus Omnitrophota bacterium]